jgi:FtsZ-binding cell division protein ZapB
LPSWCTIAALLSGLLLFLNRRNRRRQQHLRGQMNGVKEAIAALDPQASAEDSAQRDNLRQEHYQLNRQLSGWSIRLRIIQMATVVIWLIAVSLSMRLFPQTRTLGVLLIRQPVWLMLLWFALILAVQGQPPGYRPPAQSLGQRAVYHGFNGLWVRATKKAATHLVSHLERHRDRGVARDWPDPGVPYSDLVF